MNLSLQTKGRHGYAVEFSPFFANKLACASSQYYGIAGCGTLYIIETGPKGLVPLTVLDWNDGLFDITWAENNENVLITGAGDGHVVVWDINQRRGPIKAYKEHTKEVNSVHWSQTRQENFFLSGSWDKSIKLWDISHAQSLNTFLGHEAIVYSVRWSPHIPGSFASASGDQTVRVWDVRNSNTPQTVIPAHASEILTCDWSKYDQNLLFTGGVDGAIRGWDIRNPQSPFCDLRGHTLAVRRIKTSPFQRNILASVSYDFTTRLWDFTINMAVETLEHHTEFVYGLDFNIFKAGEMADCSWDEVLRVYTPRSLTNPGMTLQH
ncbi:peroxisomal targeting signal 2 receptor-like [Crassostrea virginica]